MNLCQITVQEQRGKKETVGSEDKCNAQKSEIRVTGMCFRWQSGNQHTPGGEDEWVGTSSLLSIMVGRDNWQTSESRS